MSQRALLVAMGGLCLFAWTGIASAQGLGQLPAQTFNPVFDTNVGHTSQIQEVTLSGSTVVLEYDAATYIVQWPDHRNHQRTFWLKNTGSVAVGPVYYRVRNQTGADSASATLHGGLAPGERVQIAYLFAWNRIAPAPGTCDECFYQIAGTELAQNWSITAFLCSFIGPDGNCQDADPPIASAPQSWILRVQSVAQRPKSGTVHGRVIDAVTGRDIANAGIEVVNPSGEIRLAPFNVHMALTGQGSPLGNYTIATVAMTALIRCTAPGYQTQHRVVEVAAGQSVTADFAMSAMPWTASYTLKTSIDAIGIWGWAQTPDGQQVVLTPALDFGIVLSEAFAWFMNVTDGTIAWKHFLGGQSAGPSISPDGTRVAIPLQEGSGGPGTAALRILNRTDGSLVLSRSMPSAFNPMSSAFSPDGTRIVVGGSGGQLWLLDTATYSTLWIIQLQAQTRAVAWSSDSQTIYATSDPSPIYAVNRADGSVRWRSYTTSFAYQDNISQTADGTRIAFQAKYGGFLILDNNGNDIFRQGARDGGGAAALASPDGSFFFGSAGQFNGSHVVDPAGRLYWWSRNTSEGVTLTADNKFLLIGTSLNELGGTELWTNAAAEVREPHVAIITPDKRHILVAGGKGIDTFEGQICMPTVSSSTAFVGSGGGTGSITVSVDAGCAWTATSEDTFITLTGATSGSGNGSVPYSVPAGTATRRGYLRIAGYPITITQSLFTDDPLIAGTTTVKGAHITELRQYVDTLRARYTLPTMSWTDTIVAGATTIKAIHIVELRSALDAAFVAANRTPPNYASAITASTTLISMAHISEIRAAILSIY